MKRNTARWGSNALSLLAFFAMSSLFLGCNEMEEMEKWISQTSHLRSEALKHAEIIPYRNEQFHALKSYFSQITLIVLQLNQEKDFAKKFNEVFAKLDPEQVCARVLVFRSDWDRIKERCTRNQFFLCSEEVRSYPDVLSSLRDKLSPKNQERFDGANSCIRSMKND